MDMFSGHVRPDSIEGIKGRRIILGDSVLVYRNLNNARISIKSNSSNCKGLVLGYADKVRLRSFDPVKISHPGRERVTRSGVRNVHCFAKGDLLSVSLSDTEFKRVLETHDRLTYNPFTDKGFVYDLPDRPLFTPKSNQEYDLVVAEGRLYIKEI
ncbi:hypothetical protein VIBNIFTn2_120163 [Vibrio nigripulchritudo FTn2]|uniref:hypothetical protein n=1 Tax=Vibrio nigripulchritudo TaxID=28173 RepID=UPI0003B1EF91|nr:hypothetical protein [Vibrio nigripulchritudo]CCN40181.1 hypothetical protein VIBNIFTn2_120163 [Vibrio nigripulchritudo FTn2]